MSWVRVDDRFLHHPKVVRAGLEAVGLWLLTCCWSSTYETDGRLPIDILDSLPGYKKTLGNRLVSAGLWEEIKDESGGNLIGFQIHDYLDFNPSAEELKVKRAGSAQRMRKSRNRCAATDAQVSRDSHVSCSAPSRPDPDPIHPSDETPLPPKGGSAGVKIKTPSGPDAYAVLAALQREAQGALLLGDLVPATPAPPGLSGRLPMSLEGQWQGILRAYREEFACDAAEVMQRCELAGRFLAAGGFDWARKGSTGVSLHALCDPRRDWFARLLGEAREWQERGAPSLTSLARNGSQGGPQAQETPEQVEARRQQALRESEERRRKMREREENKATPEEAAEAFAKMREILR